MRISRRGGTTPDSSVTVVDNPNENHPQIPRSVGNANLGAAGVLVGQDMHGDGGDVGLDVGAEQAEDVEGAAANTQGGN